MGAEASRAGSPRTKRLRKKLAKALGHWPLIAAAARDRRGLRVDVVSRPRKRADHRRTPDQVREDCERAAGRWNGEMARQRAILDQRIAELESRLVRMEVSPDEQNPV